MTEFGDDRELDTFFAAARAKPPLPSDALTARVLRDAETAMARHVATPVRPTDAPFVRWRALLAALGGWGTVTGLASAVMAGIWLGFAPPEGLAGLAGDILPGTMVGAADIEQLDLMPEFGSDLTEG